MTGWVLNELNTEERVIRCAAKLAKRTAMTVRIGATTAMSRSTGAKNTGGNSSGKV